MCPMWHKGQFEQYELMTQSTRFIEDMNSHQTGSVLLVLGPIWQEIRNNII
jgi:hypothetical protein